MKRKILAALLCTTMVIGLGACGNSGDKSKETASSGEEGLSGDLVFAIYDNNLMTIIDEKDMVGKFQEKYPDVNIEVEKMKDDTEYWNSMKMRASANQLPDVMVNKTFTLSRFKEYLLDLSDLEATKNNEYAEGYAVDGKILGLPTLVGGDYVFYWKDQFEEAKIEIPKTWEEYKEAAATLQEHFGAENPDYMAIAMGEKDEWPDYSFMEFMPAAQGGNGQNWNDMAKTDTPFAEGTDVNTAYHKINDLFTSGVFGKDPLGIGQDQAISLFAQKQAGMIVANAGTLQSINTGADSLDDLGTFYLPFRDTEEDPFNYVVQGDNFLGVTTHSKNPELAKAFVEWFMSEDWYETYINCVSDSSTMKTSPKEKEAVLKEADDLEPDLIEVMYDGGGDDFQAIQNEVAFDYKKLGAEMFTDGFDLEQRLSELDEKWTKARSSLNIE
ncbi:Multiple sugar-binding protein [Blautia producta]|uniref:Multiple sugar-binding protein n=1 Tax=Blautia producta TaxID=33035 RepID=A0A4P6LXH8_9FIRM|nr:ABC transporter substrate-binding protein [Blautia producta]QBE97301.1 Multiple sugar-binding protein [Blautia producta]